MKLYLEKLSPEEWKEFSEPAHLIAFGEDRIKDMDRIDYALVTKNDTALCAYATIIEIDKESVYMQHGGAFPGVSGDAEAPTLGSAVNTVKSYMIFVNWLKEHYACITTKAFNKNIAMIKMAMAAGLEINGIECHFGDIFVNLMWRKV